MFKTLTDFLHRTPWWGLIAFGLSSGLLLAALAVPFNVIQLQSRGETPAQQRAIQREIDAAFGTSALDVAEHVVATIQGLSNDPVRQAELQGALAEIARARHEIEARQEGSDARHDNLPDEATMALREAEIDTAMDLYEAAVDLRQGLEDSQEELQGTLKRSGIPATEWPQSLQQKLNEARNAENAAKQRLDEARAQLHAATAEPADAPQHPQSPASSRELRSELRDEIQTMVARDFARMAIAGILLILLIPALMVVVIAKFFIDRARGSQQLAEEKSSEAERHNIHRQLTEARLQALQAQVEPHFLYNTLANVQALIEVDPPAAGVMVGHLIDYLRAALPKMRESNSTVAQEVELARAYLNILQMRMGERLRFDIALEPAAASCALPPLMLPSLVENAIKHGLEPVRQGGHIEIFARIENASLVIGVRDNGRGLQTAQNETIDGVGLTNIRERLQAMYGDQASLMLDENPEGGVCARITLPLTPPKLNAARTPAAMLPPSPRLADGPRSIASRLGGWLTSAHAVWRRIVGAVFAVLMAVLTLGCFAAVIAIVFGQFPMQFGEAQLNGVGGAALGVLALLAGFGVLTLVMFMLSLTLYGVGILLTGIVLMLPIIIAFALAPPLAPFVVIGLLIYWFMRKRDQRSQLKTKA
jgi:hypothetical protein